MGTLQKLLFHWLCLQVIFSIVFSDVWKVEVESKMNALVKSCVVLPCKFNYPGRQLSDSRVRGIWHKEQNRNEIIYHEDPIQITDSFKDRTKLLGRMSDKNCTLEIDHVRDHDDGPFCFRTEIPDLDKYSFLENCVTVVMMVEPKEPELTRQEFLEVGEATTLKCSVKHTCPSHPPTLTWSRLDSRSMKNNRYLSKGEWEVESFLTFTPAEDDDHTIINCTVRFHGGKSSVATNRIYVKREKNYFHIIIPVVAVVGTAILFGGVCIFMSKKYKRQIQNLQSRNENGMFGRLSRISHRSYRRSEPAVNMATKSNNCVSTVSSSAGFSKPRFPSPKSEKKTYSKSATTCSANYDDDDYTNMGDLNVYGNI